MSPITTAEAILIDIPVETVRTDAVQAFIKQETIICTISDADGNTGTGYSYTIGVGGSSVLAMVRDHFLPALIGTDAARVEQRWGELYALSRSASVGPITALALAAVDTALWDLRCRRADQPLWVMAGGASQCRPVYDTEVGWLHLDVDTLVEGAVAANEKHFAGVKIKVGKPTIAEDVERVAAVRTALGPDRQLFVDANQSMTAPQAIRTAHALEPFDVGWLEEPLPADDISGHQRLAMSTSIPIAVGESMYSTGQFAEYVSRGAAGILQVDVARVGGITPWLKVAHMAETHNLTIAPHFLMELHVSLVCAVPNGAYVEYIPQLRSVTNTPIEIIDGHAVAPQTPGIGIDWNRDAIDELRVA